MWAIREAFIATHTAAICPTIEATFVKTVPSTVERAVFPT
jgi:hypothetical protein